MESRLMFKLVHRISLTIEALSALHKTKQEFYEYERGLYRYFHPPVKYGKTE